MIIQCARKEQDRVKATEVLNFLNVNTTISKPIRLGTKRNDEKPRLLRITVDGVEVKREILKKAKGLKQAVNKGYDRIFLTPDLTPSQREESSKLRAQLRLRRDKAPLFLQEDFDLEEDISFRDNTFVEHDFELAAQEEYLSCFYTNAEGFLNKRSEFFVLIEERKPHIIGITETWLSDNVLDAEIAMKGYNLFRKERANKAHGGLLLYVNEKLHVTICNELCQLNPESLWCTVEVDKHNKVLIGLCYRSMYNTPDENEQLFYQLRFIESVQSDHVLIIGDFNLKEINWKDMLVNASVTHPSNTFFEIINDLYLVQHVKSNTRHRDGQRSSQLDLIITDDDFKVSNLLHLPPLGKSDHDCLFWQYVYKLDIPSKETKSFHNYNKGDYISIKRELSNINWSDEFDNQTTDEMYNSINEVLCNMTELYIPTFGSTRSKGQNKPWMTSAVKKSVKKKYQLYKSFRETQNERDHMAYKKQNNRTRQAVRNAQATFEKKILMEFKNKPENFHKYVRSKQKVKTGITKLVNNDGLTLETDYEISEELNKCFQTFFTKEDPDEDITNFNYDTCDKSVENIEFSQEDVFKQLRGLKIDKSPGPDNIHPCLLNKCAEELSEPLYLLFKKSTEEGKLPKIWKRADVSPIFKKGSKSQASNYRPISLTCIICKIFEHIIRNNILRHVKNNAILTTEQHGFVEKKSCLTNLLEFMEDVTKALDDNNNVDVIFLDYSKAFDSVPHRRLLMKLESYGIKGQLLLWIKDFLDNRQQRVKVRHASSSWADVISGVPQGGVGPYIWSKEWMLGFNKSKCMVMHFGHSNVHFKYQIDEVELETVEKIKDLGVLITNDCKPSQHCAKVSQRAMNCLRSIRRTFVYMDKDCFNVIYKHYVRPHLEFCVQVWNPYLQKDINVIERVQRRATKLVPCIRSYSYEDRLKFLGLTTLYDRRIRGDLIEAYKIVKGFEGVAKDDFFQMRSNISRITRGHHLRFFKPTFHKGLNCRRHTFSQRVINHWNSLPADVVNSETANTFKNRIDTM
ncbi:uncharacterized protein [Antedon mediterranea]|uniref:uncharacterized protein n=1 Tax=Antedon mediterranea TaxID=105859 RepID=UPI003AF80973